MRSYVLSACMAAALVTSGQAQAGKKLDSIFTIDMLNVQVAYLEKTLGPAKRVTPWRSWQVREYTVDACKLFAWAQKGNVLQYELPLTGKCQANLSQLVRNQKTTRDLTVGSFADSPLTARADCISMCGNAADPVVTFLWEGAHVDNFLKIALSVTLATEPAIDAADKWGKAMTAKEGSDFVTDAKFNCTNKYDDVATESFKRIPVTSFGFGFSLVQEEPDIVCRK